MRVAAISLNRGEVRRVARGNAGDRIGWDFAGIVEQAASDGSGPKAGSRVVGMLESGAWAEQIAVETEAIAGAAGCAQLRAGGDAAHRGADGALHAGDGGADPGA